MVLDHDIEQLAAGLHRKLKNYGADIRAYRKRRLSEQVKEELDALVVGRQVMDQTYSACIQNLKRPAGDERDAHYQTHLTHYRTY